MKNLKKNEKYLTTVYFLYVSTNTDMCTQTQCGTRVCTQCSYYRVQYACMNVQCGIIRFVSDQ